MNRLIASLGLVFALTARAGAADLSATGGWTEFIDATDLEGGAGTDVRSQHESSVGTTVIAISNTSPGTWRVFARRSDGTWDGNLTLWIRRTSDGSGTGSIEGGDTFVQLDTIDTEIFSGIEDRTNISLQFRLTGMSKSISPNTYNSSVIFTVTQ